MKASVDIAGCAYAVDLRHPIDLSLPLSFEPGRTPEAFSLPAPSQQPVRAGSFVGNTREGGAVNCFAFTIVPHGSGTHTECVGHIVDDDVTIAETLRGGLRCACLLTVQATPLGESRESYRGIHQATDLVVTSSALEAAREGVAEAASFAEALVLRVQPRVDEPRTHRYSGSNPPYFTDEAIASVVRWGVCDLLVELPSIDREDDGGGTPAHHTFFGVEQGSHLLAGGAPRRTVTEMIVVPPDVPDGIYLIDLQIPPLLLDATPSRPLLFALSPLGDLR